MKERQVCLSLYDRYKLWNCVRSSAFLFLGFLFLKKILFLYYFLWAYVQCLSRSTLLGLYCSNLQLGVFLAVPYYGFFS